MSLTEAPHDSDGSVFRRKQNMPKAMCIFLDFDDTLSEQIPFNLQFCRAIGDFVAAIYGGDPEDWAQSAIDMMVALEADYLARFRADPTNGYCGWLESTRARATELLFAGMNIETPATAVALSIRIQAEALAHCNALFPSAHEAVTELRTQGFDVHMASGNESAHLSAALRAVGLEASIGHFFGPDLIDCAKEGPEFYRRIFQRLNLPAERALIVDNDPVAIGWAVAAGASAIQVNLLPDRHVETAIGATEVIADLRDLAGAAHRAQDRQSRT
jgi:FMN phosphatase YigB (HAD superfamily)